MRITDNMRFNTTINSLFNSQSQYNDIMEKVASQKKVNRASDDPVGATKIFDIRQGMAANEQYKKNMEYSDTWINITESKLSSAYDLLVKAQEIAIGQATATANATTRNIASQQVQSLIDEMISLANTKLGDRYLFSGSRNEATPFSATWEDAKIEAAGEAGNNTFQGTVVSSGTYTGSTNKTYVVKITQVGTLDTATCQVSTDGGRTWNDQTEDGTDLSVAGSMSTGAINLGDGVMLTLDDAGGTEAFGLNDVFTVNAITGGYYQGNNDAQSLMISRGTSITYNITGTEAFTTEGSNGVDVLQTLTALKDSLESNSAQGISDQLGNLRNAQNQISLNQSLCGTKANHIEMTKNNLSDLDTKLMSMLSETQDADLAEYATKLSIKELALQASYALAAKIGNTTILNFLK